MLSAPGACAFQGRGAPAYPSDYGEGGWRSVCPILAALSGERDQPVDEPHCFSASALSVEMYGDTAF